MLFCPDKRFNFVGLEEGILNRIESDSPDTKVRLRQALGTFQSKLDPTEVDTRQLIQRVHSSLQEAGMIREAREINKNYL